MVIDYDGQSYFIRIEDVTVSQAIEIMRSTGFTMAEFHEALSSTDEEIRVIGLQVLYWLMTDAISIQRAEFSIFKLSLGFRNAIIEEAEYRHERERREYNGLTKDEHFALRFAAMERGEITDFMEQLEINKYFTEMKKSRGWFEEWFTKSVIELRARYRWDFGKNLGMSVTDVDKLTVPDFFQYIAALDEWAKHKKRKAEQKEQQGNR